jgi:excisionase family DNA binding protein
MLTQTHRGRLLTVKEAASQLRLHPMTVRKKIERGQIPAVQLGGPGTAVRIAESELEARLYSDSGGSSDYSSRLGPVERRAPERDSSTFEGARPPAGDQ